MSLTTLKLIGSATLSLVEPGDNVEKPNGNLYVAVYHVSTDDENPLALLHIGDTKDVSFHEWLTLVNLFNDKLLGEGTFVVLLQLWIILQSNCPSLFPMPYLADKLLPYVDEHMRIHFFTEKELPNQDA